MSSFTRNIFFVIFVLFQVITFGQEHTLHQIQKKVQDIEKDTSLIMTEVDWVILTGITTDGGGILKVWHQDGQISKIMEEIGLSYGRVRTTIYLDNRVPIKIIETEENFEKNNQGFNYKNLHEVFKVTIHIFNWNEGLEEIERKGKRVFTERPCSTFEYESTLERAEKAIKK